MLPLSVENLLLTLREFLVVWIYQILYFNDIYDENIFSKHKSFDIVIYKTRQPHLEDYVKGLVNDILRILLEKNSSSNLCSFAILVYDFRKNELKKKYVLDLFDLVNLGDLPVDKSFLTEESPRSETPIDVPECTWNEVYSQLRALTYEHINELRRQKQLQSDVNNIDVFYRPVIELDDSVNLDFHDDSAWVLHSGKNLRRETVPPVKHVQLGELSLGLFNFGLHNEYLQ